MKLFGIFETKAKANDTVAAAATMPGENDNFKAFITEGIYKPPFGYPRPLNIQQTRLLAKTAYIHSIVQTLCDEVATTPWDIRVKEHFAELGEEDPTEEVARIREFFLNPNGNDESWEDITRMVVRDILELDSGVLVNVFDDAGNLKQVFARDGGSFLKNPDIFGYMGNREDIIPQYNYVWNPETRMYQPSLKFKTVQDVETVKESAAYFQYGWTPGSVPIPFGKKEIVYLMRNPRSDSVYGTAPIEMLGEVLYTLIYGSSYNLDFYTNNNMPEGILSLIGANQTHIDSVRERMDSQIRFKDNLGKWRKKFFKVPITNTDVKFTPFQLLSKDLEVLQQQQWFIKLVWACFGINAEELGFTEDSNKAVSQTQSKVAIRKGIKPLLKILQYRINTQIMPLLDKSGKLEFVYDEYDPDTELKQLQIYQAKAALGVMTPEMIAEELGIDVDRLKKEKEEQRQKDMEMMGGSPQESWKPVSERSPKDEKPEAKSVEVKYKYLRRTGTSGNYHYTYNQQGQAVFRNKEQQRMYWVDSTLRNDESSTDAELVEHFVKEGEFTREQAEYFVSQREQAMNDPEYRANLPAEKPQEQKPKEETASAKKDAPAKEESSKSDGLRMDVGGGEKVDVEKSVGDAINAGYSATVTINGEAYGVKKKNGKLVVTQGSFEGDLVTTIGSAVRGGYPASITINGEEYPIEKKSLPKKEEDFPGMDDHFDEARRFIDEEVERLFTEPLEKIR